MLSQSCIKFDLSQKISSEVYRNGAPQRDILPSAAAYNEHIIRETTSTTGPQDFWQYPHLATSTSTARDTPSSKSNPQYDDVGAPTYDSPKEIPGALIMTDVTVAMRQEQITLVNYISDHQEVAQANGNTTEKSVNVSSTTEQNYSVDAK
jgi:hypothetical protein